MPGDSQLQCIYCLETKPVAEFNREHVVPESFGGFEDAPVLSDSVCENCNTYFGATLDLRLARGSDEGFQRYIWNVRPPEQIERFRYDSVTFQYDGEGDYRGCFLRLTADPEAPNGFRATPIDQVGFSRREEDGFVWIRLNEVLQGAWRDRDDLNPQAGIRIYARDPESVKAHLEEQGVSFPNWRPMARDGESGDEASVLQVAEITKDLRRVVAKISFNYLAYVHDAQFALRPEFNGTRRFIRYGEGGEGLVGVDDESPIPLPPNTPDGHRPVVHVVTVERAVTNRSTIMIDFRGLTCDLSWYETRRCEGTVAHGTGTSEAAGRRDRRDRKEAARGGRSIGRDASGGEPLGERIPMACPRSQYQGL